MPNPAALARADQAQLVIIDVQERLAAAMGEADRARLLKGAGLLLAAAAELGVPVHVTEQYPKGLGPTLEPLLERLPADAPRLAKTGFSCCAAGGFEAALDGTGRRQVVLAGMEAHVCVLQTALELLARDYTVFVAEDAVCSRDPAMAANGLARLRQAGVIVSNSESVVFEWLGDAGHASFKSLSALLR